MAQNRLHTITKSVADILKQLPPLHAPLVFNRTKWRRRSVGTPDYDMMFQMMKEESGSQITIPTAGGADFTIFFYQSDQFRPMTFEVTIDGFRGSIEIGDGSVDPRNKNDWEVTLELLQEITPLIPTL
jgi:hypothetical protein